MARGETENEQFAGSGGRGIILVPLWGHFGYMKVHFQKIPISHTYFDDFIKGVSEFEIDLGLLWESFGKWGCLWVHFGATLGSHWAYRRRIAGMICVVAGLMVSWSAPNGSQNKLYSFPRRILLVQDGPDDAIAANNSAKNGTLGSLCAYRRRIAGMMCVVAGLMVSWSAPNGAQNKLYSFSRRILLTSDWLTQITVFFYIRRKKKQ